MNSRLVGGGLVVATRAIKLSMAAIDSDEGEPAAVILDLWIFVFGLMIILVEDLRCSGDFRRGLTRRRLYHFFRVLFLPPGRGYFYLMVACLLLARHPMSTIDDLLGAYMGGLALVTIAIGHYCAYQLARLKDAFPSEVAVRQTFAAVGDELDRVELAALAESVGVPLGPLSLDAAMSFIDADQNGTIGQTEFLDWWLVDL